MGVYRSTDHSVLKFYFKLSFKQRTDFSSHVPMSRRFWLNVTIWRDHHLFASESNSLPAVRLALNYLDFQPNSASREAPFPNMIKGWGAKQVLKSLLWLRRENLNQGHIYIRPAGPHGLSLIDDLNADALVRMKAEGFAPAAVVETSPGNFQAWLKHYETLDELTSTRAAKMLVERHGGDPGGADWRHFGRARRVYQP
jgi:RepB DNA-primase from phage plasmid